MSTEHGKEFLLTCISFLISSYYFVRYSINPVARGSCLLRFWHRSQDKYKFTKSPAFCLHNPLTSPFPQLWFSAFFSSLASPLLSFSWCLPFPSYFFNSLAFSIPSQWDLWSLLFYFTACFSMLFWFLHFIEGWEF